MFRVINSAEAERLQNMIGFQEFACVALLGVIVFCLICYGMVIKRALDDG